jgi:sterol 3beta-glucosyltransferase
MHYAIVAIGSRGDVQPYIALALGLNTCGQTTTIFAHENFKDFIEKQGVLFIPVSGHVEDMLQSSEGMKVVRSGSLSAFTKYLQKVNKITAGSIRDLADEFEKADVLVASLLAMPWVDAIAEKFNKRWAIVQLNLPSVPTKRFPFILLDFINFPAYNLFTYRLFEWAYWKANKKNINYFRRSLNLPALKKPFLEKISEDKILNLHCFSPALLARPDDWAPEVDITGFLFMPETKQSEIPERLIQWLEKGDKPVYIGFGSIPVPDPALFKSVLKDLLEKTSDRFIFCYGWTQPMDLPEDPRLYQVKSVAHNWLFPRCRAAIVHGGVGTTAAVLRANIPVIIISIIADQPWWGKIIEQKGVGIHIPFKKLTAKKLMSALIKTESAEVKLKAFQMGEQINADDGLSHTIYKLENYFTTAQAIHIIY